MPAAIVPPSGTPIGWGSEPWGSGGWGGPTSGILTLLSAVAIAENVIQLVFSNAVYFSGLLDTPDASNPALYTVTANTSTTGYDGNSARPVNAIVAALSTSADIPPGTQYGAAIDVTLDRPMSPYPATYTIAVQGIYQYDLSQELTPSSITLYGVYRTLVRPSADLPTPTRDIANPSSLSGTVGLANAQNPAILGVFSIDSSGDYANDQGLASYKKRIYRRLVTRPGGFLHLGNGYGVGVPQQAKKLARSATIQQLASSAERQIALEPETQQCQVTVAPDQVQPWLARFTILAKVKGGQGTKFSAAFPTQ
jgi:hypothetical protein